MKDEMRTKEELAEELSILRSEVAGLKRPNSERKQTEGLLQESTEQYRLLFESTSDVVYSIDADFRILCVSPSVERVLGYRCEEIIGKYAYDMKFLPPESLEKGLSDISRILKGETVAASDYEFIAKDGTRRIGEISGAPLIREGKITGVICVARDRSEHKRAEEEQRLSRETAERLAEETAVIAEIGRLIGSTLDIEEVYERFAAEARKLIPFDRIAVNLCNVHENNLTVAYVSGVDISNRKKGDYPPLAGTLSEEVMRGRTGLIIQPESIDEIVSRIPALSATFQVGLRSLLCVPLISRKEVIGALHFRSKKPDAYKEQDLRLAEKIGAQIAGAIANAQLFTDLKKTEISLREREKRFRTLIEHAAVGIAEMEAGTGRFLDVNPMFCEMVGRTEKEMLATTVMAITHPEDLNLHQVLSKRMYGGEFDHYSLEKRYLRKDGGVIWVNVTVSRLWKPGEAPGKSITIVHDITERKRMEEELLRAHKLESLGVLAGGIAHDFNNLMAVVQGYIDLALMDLPPDHVSRQRLLTAMRSVEQTKDLTSRLITFSRGGGPHRETLDVAEIIRDAVHRTEKGTEVRVKFDFMENLWPVEVDELQMKQVFYNLATNAIEAMPTGGNLTIQAENAEMSAGEIFDLIERPYLKITFTDEGIGIPKEHLLKIFDPYFTTKGMGAQKGLGLGLAVCHSVLKKHDGHIMVKSQPGEGASFVLYLPARVEPAKEKEVKKTLSIDTVRVLIMDDEPHIRVIERDYLERLGYEVMDVKDGQEAIAIYTKALDTGNPFDLVILDLTVRRGLGGQLAMARLLKIDPSIKAIIASGYLDDPVIENYADYGFQGALTKPFKGEEMKKLVEKILHG